MIKQLHKFAESDNKLANLLRKTLDTSVWISADGVGASVLTVVALGQPHHIIPYAITFLMIFSMYNMDRLSGILEDEERHPKRYAFIGKYQHPILILSIASVILSLTLAIQRNTNTTIMVLAPIVLALCYSLNILPKPWRTRRIKDTTLGKPIILSLCWAIITVGVVAAYYDIPPSLGVFALAFIVFSRSITSSIVCDIRDITVDVKQKSSTLPLVLGESNTKILLYVYITILLLFTHIFTLIRVLPKLMYIVNLTTIQAYYYIYEIHKPGPHTRTLTDFVVDSEFMVMAAVAIIGPLLIK